MQKRVWIVFLFLFSISFVCAGQNGSFFANESGTIEDLEAELEVSADVFADSCWYQVSLDKTAIDFGSVNRSSPSEQTYKIYARGTVNITVKPKLKDTSDSVFSNLFFSRTGSDSSYKSLGNYELNFGLALFSREWTVIDSYDKTYLMSNTKKGLQYIKLDLTRSKEIIPFDLIDHTNTVIFSAVPKYEGCNFTQA